MRMFLILIFIFSLFALSCQQSVSCTCHGNGVYKNYDLGIHYRNSQPNYEAICDTLGAHDHLDSCYIIKAK